MECPVCEQPVDELVTVQGDDMCHECAEFFMNRATQRECEQQASIDYLKEDSNENEKD